MFYLCDKHGHWTGQKIGGDLHHQKFKVGEEQELLTEVREKTGGLSVKDVIPASNVKSKSATIQDVNMQDVNMSDDEDMLVESEADSSDDMLYGPSLNNTIQTEESDFSFDVNQYSSVRRIFDDKSYREEMSVDNKNEVIRLLSKEVLEQRTLMDLGRKLNILRKKCEGYRIDTEFLWILQDAFNTKLGGHIVKNEESASMESLISYFPVGSIDA